MVVNQKNKYEMKHNLALFLGKSSDDFVNWLFDYLPQLKLSNNTSNIKNSSNNEDKKQEQQHSAMINKENFLELNRLSPKLEKMDNLRNNVKEQPKVQGKRKLKSAIVSCFSEENNVNVKKIKPMNNRRTITQNSNGQKQLQSKIEIKQDLTNNHNGNADIIETNSTLNNNDFEKSEITTVLDKNEKETKFFVTLDGVKNAFKGLSISKKMIFIFYSIF